MVRLTQGELAPGRRSPGARRRCRRRAGRAPGRGRGDVLGGGLGRSARHRRQEHDGWRGRRGPMRTDNRGRSLARAAGPRSGAGRPRPLLLCPILLNPNSRGRRKRLFVQGERRSCARVVYPGRARVAYPGRRRAGYPGASGIPRWVASRTTPVGASRGPPACGEAPPPRGLGRESVTPVARRIPPVRERDTPGPARAGAARASHLPRVGRVAYPGRGQVVSRR